MMNKLDQRQSQTAFSAKFAGPTFFWTKNWKYLSQKNQGLEIKISGANFFGQLRIKAQQNYGSKKCWLKKWVNKTLVNINFAWTFYGPKFKGKQNLIDKFWTQNNVG